MIVVLTDIHGCYGSLQLLVDKVLSKYDVYKFIVLGDFIDRGKYSLEVTNFLIDLSKKYHVVMTKGNHEDLLLDYLNEQNKLNNDRWKRKDGVLTISSFSKGKLVDFNDISRDDVYPYFADYVPFFSSAVDYHIEKIGKIDFLFSHAGISEFDLPLFEQYTVSSEEKSPFVWSRNMGKIDKMYQNMLIVHGHIPVQSLVGKGFNKPHVKYDKKGKAISVDIDTGCIYGGLLSAMVIDNTGKFNFETVKCVD